MTRRERIRFAKMVRNKRAILDLENMSEEEYERECLFKEEKALKMASEK